MLKIETYIEKVEAGIDIKKGIEISRESKMLSRLASLPTCT